MRTLSDILEALKDVMNSERSYLVDGTIVMTFFHPFPSSDYEYFRIAIENADRMYPWRDELPSSADEPKLRLNKEPEVSEDGRTLRFHIRPHRCMIRKGQVYAYEKYLANIGMKLVDNQRYDNGLEVETIIHVHRRSWFSKDRQLAPVGI